MSDFSDTELAALFAAQRALDGASAPPFETPPRAAVFGSRRFRRRRLVRRELIVAAAAAVLVLTMTLVARRQRERLRERLRAADAADISYWSAPTDVLLRSSDEALRVPNAGTSALLTRTGN
jgi:hypothetical protein